METSSILPKALASAPLDSEGARQLLQQRVALMAFVLVCFGLASQVFVRSIDVLAHGSDYASGADWTPDVHLLVVAVTAFAWWRTRRGRRAERELQAWDFACVLLPAAFSLFVMWGTPPSVHPPLVNQVSIGNVLVLRAVLVPSSGRRTAALGVLVGLALVVWAYAYNSVQSAPSAPPLLAAAGTTLWSAMTLALTTLASHTIFGLRQRVREASELGQYTLLREIGAGGMGVVYEARHALLRRRTAVKLLPPDRAGEHSVLRFEREVQLTASLTHPNTIAIYDYGRSPDGVFYYAMEYLDGVDLEQLVRELGPQHPGLVAQVIEQVCAALAEAHAVGLIHRDIKPANVFLCERGGIVGFAKVVDFGLVKRLDDAADPGLSSAGNAILGTPLYLSPEGIARPDEVDARSDLYSVGALAYYLLAGVPVFEGKTTLEVCGHHLYSEPAPPSARLGKAIPAGLEALVLSCLHKDAGKRPQSAAALAAAMAELRAQIGWDGGQAQAWWAQCRKLASSPRAAQAKSSDALATTRRALTVELQRRD